MLGKPLAHWVLKEAEQSSYIDEVYVSTEDEKIKQAIQEHNPEVRIIHRPQELAQDTTPEELVHLHVMEQISFDILAIVHATNPLTTAKDLDLAIETLEKGRYHSLVTGTRHKRFYWTSEGKPLNYDPLKRPRTQDFEGTITENGAFYLTRPEILRKHKNFLGGKIGIYEMRPEQALDIDTLSDWEEAEKIFREIKGL